VFNLIEGTHGIQQDLAEINPDYPQSGRTDNCANCVAAYEMRRRGNDVTAGEGGFISYDEWVGMFEGFEPLRPIGGTKAQVAKELEREILLWGEGARGMVVGMHDRGHRGHTFSVEVSGGKVMFVDGQTNEEDVTYFFDILKPKSIVYGRLDNLKPTDWVKNAVRNRRALL